MTEREELLNLILEQTILIRNLKIKIRLIDPEGEFYPPEDFQSHPEIVRRVIKEYDRDMHPDYFDKKIFLICLAAIVIVIAALVYFN